MANKFKIKDFIYQIFRYIYSHHTPGIIELTSFPLQAYRTETRIKNVLKFQNFENVNWLSTSVVRQNDDFRQIFHFKHPEVRGLFNLFRYDTGEVKNWLNFPE